jgi:hypothetical protein
MIPALTSGSRPHAPLAARARIRVSTAENALKLLN